MCQPGCIVNFTPTATVEPGATVSLGTISSTVALGPFIPLSSDCAAAVPAQARRASKAKSIVGRHMSRAYRAALPVETTKPTGRV